MQEFSGRFEHWERLLPGKIFRIRHEELVADPEVGTRRLLDHCGLSFDEACLSFHQTERVILNASNTQVRQPVYSNSVGRWVGG
ncbi:MAG: sulfotransferase, partial [Gammaproteobacteria bacterium]|nr:sulfotransferase [Gammaproteobacteria bacterium]